MMEQQEFAIGRYRLQLGRRLLRDGAPVALGAKPLSILSILVQAGGNIVTKNELMEKAWPGQVIEENALHAHISAIRKALAEESGWIVTAAGRGYSFAGPVSLVEPAEPMRLAEAVNPAHPAESASLPEPSSTFIAPGRNWPRAGILAVCFAAFVGAALAAYFWLLNPTAPAQTERYAVLPFVNRTGDPQNDDLASQLTDETAARLVNKTWHISVISAKTALAEGGAAIDEAALGRKLDLDYIVKGSLQRLQGKFEASVALIDAKSGVLLSSGHAERDPADSTTVARWLAAAIANLIIEQADADRKNRLAVVPPGKESVHDLLDQARLILEQKPPAEWSDAIRLADRALAAGPQNAEALYLSGAIRADLIEYSAYANEIERQNFITIAERRLVEAELAAPDHPSVHVELGMLRDHEGQREAARAEYQRALEIDGASTAAHIQIALDELYAGHAEQALTLIDQTLPASPAIAFYVYGNRALALVHLGQDQAALEAIRRAVAAEPDDPWALLYFIGILQLVGQTEEAPQALAHLRKILPRLTVARLRILDENTSPLYRSRQERLYEALMKVGLPNGEDNAL